MQERLDKLDIMINELINENGKLTKDLEELRNSGDTKSYKFRELLGRKLINNAIIEALKSHELM